MQFKYLTFHLKYDSLVLGTAIFRPIIPLTVSYRGIYIKYAALIDSGADFCIFDAELAEYLGINVKSGIRETFGGVQEGSGSQAYFHEITLGIGGFEHKTLVGFSYDIAKDGYGILGQKGFFDLFIVKFDLEKKEIELKPRK